MLLSKVFMSAFGTPMRDVMHRVKLVPTVFHLPDEPQARLSAADCDQIEVAYLTRDWTHSPNNYYPKFCDAILASQNLKWVHFTSAGIDQHAFVPSLVQRGVKLTTSPGSNGEPVAQTAITGLLMLARRFPVWLNAQRRHAWEPIRGGDAPPDLRGQTVMVVGLGTVGTLVGRFCKALGMYVIGIRRTPHRGGAALDEIHSPAKFVELLPRCQWLVLSCPYTNETHHLVNAKALAALPRGAGIVNIARGGLIEEPALIDALRSGEIGGAYLDVFEQEPLPTSSPLWDLPNVIVTPHNASISNGNDWRSSEMFFANLEKWAGGESLNNEQ